MTVSRLNFEISANSRKFIQDMQAAGASVVALENQLERAQSQTAGLNGIGNRTGMIFQEGGRALEDFASVFTTSGWQGGIRAAGNNITQLLSLMGPMAGTVGSIAIGLGTLLIPRLIDTADAAEEAKDRIGEFDRIMKNVNFGMDFARQAEEFRQAMRDLGSADDAERLLQRINDESSLLKAELRELDRQLEDAVAFREQTKGRMQFGVNLEELQKQLDDANKAIAEVEEQQTARQERLRDIAFERGRAQKRLAELQAQEAEAAQQTAEAAQQAADAEKMQQQAAERQRRNGLEEDLRREMGAEIDPDQARVDAVLNEFSARRNQIAEEFANDPAKMQELMALAFAASRAELDRMSPRSISEQRAGEGGVAFQSLLSGAAADLFLAKTRTAEQRAARDPEERTARASEEAVTLQEQIATGIDRLVRMAENNGVDTTIVNVGP